VRGGGEKQITKGPLPPPKLMIGAVLKERVKERGVMVSN
jgi:hypothetical protein